MRSLIFSHSHAQPGRHGTGGYFRRPAGAGDSYYGLNRSLDRSLAGRTIAHLDRRILTELGQAPDHDDRSGSNPHPPKRLAAYMATTGKRRGPAGFDEFFDYPGNHPDGTRRFEGAFRP